jgi:hypothetical protein
MAGCLGQEQPGPWLATSEGDMEHAIQPQQAVLRHLPKKVPQEGLVHERTFLPNVGVVKDDVVVRNACADKCW